MSYMESFIKGGYQIPPRETNIEALTVQQLFNKLVSFRERQNKVNFDTDGLDTEFVAIIREYPVSMCQREMTENLKILIAFYYVYTHEHAKAEAAERLASLETQKDDYQIRARWDHWVKEAKDVWEGFTYDELAIIFERPKSGIFSAVKSHEGVAHKIYESCNDRAIAKRLAMEQLIAEEKAKLIESNAVKSDINAISHEDKLEPSSEPV